MLTDQIVGPAQDKREWLFDIMSCLSNSTNARIPHAERRTTDIATGEVNVRIEPLGVGERTDVPPIMIPELNAWSQYKIDGIGPMAQHADPDASRGNKHWTAFAAERGVDPFRMFVRGTATSTNERFFAVVSSPKGATNIAGGVHPGADINDYTPCLLYDAAKTTWYTGISTYISEAVWNVDNDTGLFMGPDNAMRETIKPMMLQYLISHALTKAAMRDGAGVLDGVYIGPIVRTLDFHHQWGLPVDIIQKNYRVHGSQKPDFTRIDQIIGAYRKLATDSNFRCDLFPSGHIKIGAAPPGERGSLVQGHNTWMRDNTEDTRRAWMSNQVMYQPVLFMSRAPIIPSPSPLSTAGQGDKKRGKTTTTTTSKKPKDKKKPASSPPANVIDAFVPAPTVEVFTTPYTGIIVMEDVGVTTTPQRGMKPQFDIEAKDAVTAPTLQRLMSDAAVAYNPRFMTAVLLQCLCVLSWIQAMYKGMHGDAQFRNIIFRRLDRTRYGGANQIRLHYRLYETAKTFSDVYINPEDTDMYVPVWIDFESMVVDAPLLLVDAYGVDMSDAFGEKRRFGEFAMRDYYSTIGLLENSNLFKLRSNLRTAFCPTVDVTRMFRSLLVSLFMSTTLSDVFVEDTKGVMRAIRYFGGDPFSTSPEDRAWAGDAQVQAVNIAPNIYDDHKRADFYTHVQNVNASVVATTATRPEQTGDDTRIPRETRDYIGLRLAVLHSLAHIPNSEDSKSFRRMLYIILKACRVDIFDSSEESRRPDTVEAYDFDGEPRIANPARYTRGPNEYIGDAMDKWLVGEANWVPDNQSYATLDGHIVFRNKEFDTSGNVWEADTYLRRNAWRDMWDDYEIYKVLEQNKDAGVTPSGDLSDIGVFMDESVLRFFEQVDNPNDLSMIYRGMSHSELALSLYVDAVFSNISTKIRKYVAERNSTHDLFRVLFPIFTPSKLDQYAENLDENGFTKFRTVGNMDERCPFYFYDPVGVTDTDAMDTGLVETAQFEKEEKDVTQITKVYEQEQESEYYLYIYPPDASPSTVHKDIQRLMSASMAEYIFMLSSNIPDNADSMKKYLRAFDLVLLTNFVVFDVVMYNSIDMMLASIHSTPHRAFRSLALFVLAHYSWFNVMRESGCFELAQLVRFLVLTPLEEFLQLGGDEKPYVLANVRELSPFKWADALTACEAGVLDQETLKTKVASLLDVKLIGTRRLFEANIMTNKQASTPREIIVQLWKMSTAPEAYKGDTPQTFLDLALNTMTRIYRSALVPRLAMFQGRARDTPPPKPDEVVYLPVVSFVATTLALEGRTIIRERTNAPDEFMIENYAYGASVPLYSTRATMERAYFMPEGTSTSLSQRFAKTDPFHKVFMMYYNFSKYDEVIRRLESIIDPQSTMDTMMESTIYHVLSFLNSITDDRDPMGTMLRGVPLHPNRCGKSTPFAVASDIAKLTYQERTDGSLQRSTVSKIVEMLPSNNDMDTL